MAPRALLSCSSPSWLSAYLHTGCNKQLLKLVYCHLSLGAQQDFFLHTAAPHWIFSLSEKTLETVVSGWKSQQISSLGNTRASPSGTDNHATFKVTYVLFFFPPPFPPGTYFELQQVIFTYALSCCRAIGWFDILVNERLKWIGVKDKEGVFYVSGDLPNNHKTVHLAMLVSQGTLVYNKTSADHFRVKLNINFLFYDMSQSAQTIISLLSLRWHCCLVNNERHWFGGGKSMQAITQKTYKVRPTTIRSIQYNIQTTKCHTIGRLLITQKRPVLLVVVLTRREQITFNVV